MFTQSEYVAMNINRNARDRTRREAETARALAQASLPPARKFTAVRALVARLGRALVAIGQRLAQVDSRPAQLHSNGRGA